MRNTVRKTTRTASPTMASTLPKKKKGRTNTNPSPEPPVDMTRMKTPTTMTKKPVKINSSGLLKF
jgi:hypothetical protein